MKKIILFAIPMSICNFRCSYCYLAQRDEHYQGVMPEFKYTPEQFGRACSIERVGGASFGNFTATGETLLTKDIDLYIKEFIKQGHYAEVVTNLTVTPVIEKMLSWDKELLKRLEFKCSFHYLELKQKGMLERFAQNVNKIWEAGASATIEITPSDELIPYIEEVKQFSLDKFGALPHLTIARDDRTKNIDYLTKLPMNQYEKVWSQFHSEFWEFKRRIFGKKQTDFCYAGKWSVHVNLATGDMKQCYWSKVYGNLFENMDLPIPEAPIGKCRIAHCYNGHMLMAAGLIPELVKKDDVRYGDLRNRVKEDGSDWLQPELKQAFNIRVNDENQELSAITKRKYLIKDDMVYYTKIAKYILGKCFRIKKK